MKSELKNNGIKGKTFWVDVSRKKNTKCTYAKTYQFETDQERNSHLSVES